MSMKYKFDTRSAPHGRYHVHTYADILNFQSLAFAVGSAMFTSASQQIFLAIIVASHTEYTEYHCVLREGDPWALTMLPVVVFILVWFSIFVLNFTIITKLCLSKRVVGQADILHRSGNNISTAIISRDRQVTRLLLLIALTFTILAIPDVVIIISMTLGENVRQFWIQFSAIYEKCQTTMDVVGCSFTFMFYTITGSNFRKQIRAFMRIVFTRRSQG